MPYDGSLVGRGKTPAALPRPVRAKQGMPYSGADGQLHQDTFPTTAPTVKSGTGNAFTNGLNWKPITPASVAAGGHNPATTPLPSTNVPQPVNAADPGTPPVSSLQTEQQIRAAFGSIGQGGPGSSGPTYEEAMAGIQGQGSVATPEQRATMGETPGTPEGPAYSIQQDIKNASANMGGPDIANLYGQGNGLVNQGAGMFGQGAGNAKAMLDAGFTPDEVRAIMISGGGDINAMNVTTGNVLSGIRSDAGKTQNYLQNVMGGKDALFNQNRATYLGDMAQNQGEERNRMLGDMAASGLSGTALGVGNARQSEQDYQQNVAESELAWEEADRAARQAAAGMSTAAQGMLGGLENTQASRQLLADTSNQDANLSAAQSNQTNAYNVQSANQDAGLEADKANQQAGLDAGRLKLDANGQIIAAGTGMVGAGGQLAQNASSQSQNNAANLNAQANAYNALTGNTQAMNAQGLAANQQAHTQFMDKFGLTNLTAWQQTQIDQMDQASRDNIFAGMASADLSSMDEAQRSRYLNSMLNYAEQR